MLGDFLRTQEKHMFDSINKMNKNKKQVSLIESKSMKQFKVSATNNQIVKQMKDPTSPARYNKANGKPVIINGKKLNLNMGH